MLADLESIVCKFGGDPAIYLGEDAICAKVYRRTDKQTDGRTDDGRRAIALAHSWNELKKLLILLTKTNNIMYKKAQLTPRLRATAVHVLRPLW